MTHPTPGPGTRLFFLDGEGVLFSEPRQEIHRLNATAAVIWCLLEEGIPPDGIAARLSQDFGAPRAEAPGHVAAALDAWAAAGLLAGTEGGAPPARPWRGPSPAFGQVPHPAPARPRAWHASRGYRLGALSFKVRYATAAQLASLHPVLAHLEVAEATGPDIDLLPAGAGRTVICLDGRPVESSDGPDTLVPAAYARIWMEALRRQDLDLCVHAAVLRAPGGGDAVLLPAPPGSGKSVLTAALAAAGFGFFSDEVAPLRGEELSVAPFPQAICLKEAGLAAVAAFRPEAAALALHRRADGRRVAYLPPPVATLPGPEARASVAALVFPRYVPGAGEASCVPVARGEALSRMMQQCTILEGRLSQEMVARLVAWASRLDCRDLTYGTTSGAVAAVRDLMAGIAGRAAVGDRSSQATRNAHTAK